MVEKEKANKVTKVLTIVDEWACAEIPQKIVAAQKPKAEELPILKKGQTETPQKVVIPPKPVKKE